MKLLRNKKRLTEFLILYHSAINKPTKLAEIAQEFDMTEQGVSNYVKDMEQKGLIDKLGRRYHPTPDGMEMIRDILSEIGDFLKVANSKIDIIDKCTAIAEENIREGQEVGLYMKHGFLHASAKESSSMGTALNDVSEGHPLKVGQLHGLIEMDLGRLIISPLNMDVENGDISKTVQEKLENTKYDKIAVTGEEQYGIINMIGLKPDIIFSPVESSINAAEKGLDVLIFTSEGEAEKIVDRVRKQNSGRDEEYKIESELI